MFSSNGLTLFMLCVQICCVYWIITAEFSTANTGLGGLMLRKPLSVEYS